MSGLDPAKPTLQLSGDIENARQNFHVIKDCLDLMELPVRAAWVRLLLGECGEEAFLVEAREMFLELDIAEGVGTIDNILGYELSSIQWHINGSQKYAQLRLRALRGIAPYTRQDSERFERRLVAHRKAIAELDTSVVDLAIC